MKNSRIKNLIFVLILAMSYSCIDDFRFGDDALDKPLSVELNVDSIFSKAVLARQHLWGLYQFIPSAAAQYGGSLSGDWYESLSDIIHSMNNWGGTNTSWYSGSFSATGGDSRWAYFDRNNRVANCLSGIRHGLTFLENIDRVPDMPKEEKDRLKAEAKVIVAGKYWQMFRQYGGIPMMEKVYTPTDDPATNRATIAEMYDYMIGLLDEAINEPNLPWIIPENEQREWWGRITVAAALAQKMLVQLDAASPLFNDVEPYYKPGQGEKPLQEEVKPYIWWGGYKPELWQELRKTCEEFIRLNSANGDQYRLIQPASQTEEAIIAAYQDAYWYRGPDNSGANELIYVHTDMNITSWWDALFSKSATQWGHEAPTAEFMEMFCWANGKVFDPDGVDDVYVNAPARPTDVTNPTLEELRLQQASRPARADNYYIFDNRDPRLYETLWVQHKGQIFDAGKGVETWPGGNAIRAYAIAFSHGMSHHKWCMNLSDDIGNNGVRTRPRSWAVLRMGGFHLIYAEALAETGDLAGACREINKVRARVGLPAIETSNPQLNLTSNKENLIKQILRERVCELGYEDTRLMDMIRRKLKDDFTKQLHGVWTYRMDGKTGTLGTGEPYPEFWYVKTPVSGMQRSWWEEGGWSDKWYILPFPLKEVNKGFGLIQNPGW
ncbi:MAG: RagB/SusD family nutrient uptake outer membrane protein [Tannerella sp.]|jgi:hypothetical protein|nr:RagB/SusD family nutrient uptake outer membrane protein [Tannerella sp.]